MRNAPRQVFTKPEGRLWLAVIAKAVQDCLLSFTASKELSQEELDTARWFVSQYPQIAHRLSNIRSVYEAKQWLREIESNLDRLR